MISPRPGVNAADPGPQAGQHDNSSSRRTCSDVFGFMEAMSVRGRCQRSGLLATAFSPLVLAWHPRTTGGPRDSLAGRRVKGAQLALVAGEVGAIFAQGREPRGPGIGEETLDADVEPGRAALLRHAR